MSTLKRRAFRSMMGLAIGDALSWPAIFHRSFLLPPWTRRIRREMDTGMETNRVSRHPMPFSLNQPGSVFDLGPTDDSEWATFTAQRLIANAGAESEESVLQSWMELSRSASKIRGPVNVMTALSNLHKGVMPPACGRDNPHYFDDAALCRVSPLGLICAGVPEKAAELAAFEAVVTNAEDGVWTASAFAAALSIACAGGDTPAVISAAMSCLPEKSWSRRLAKQGLQIAAPDAPMLEVLPLLNHALINREYSYGSVAPETLALTLAIVQICGRDFERAVTTACAFAKTADSLPSLVGAVCGALSDRDFVSESWLEGLTSLKGICLPGLAGVDYVDVSRQLAELAGTLSRQN